MTKKKNKKQIGNQRINSILFSSDWQIDHQFAVSQISRYLEEISLIDKGVPFESLGIIQRKASQQTKVYSLTSNSYIETGKFSSPTLSQEADPDPQLRINVDSPPPDLDPEVEVSSSNVAHMHLIGTMFLQDQMSTRGTQSLVNDIREMNADPSFIGGVLEVDSGGGESLAGAAMEQAVSESKKPIIALVHVALSAAYRAISKADRIVAVTDSSQFGSIGSMLMIDKFLAEIDKTQFLTIYASQSGNKNKEFRDFQESGDTSGLQKLVDEGAAIFQEVVRTSRSLDSRSEDTLAGGIFRSQEAIARGLADQVGGIGSAISQIGEIISLNQKSNQKITDMSILKSIQSLFPNKVIKDETAAKAAIQELQEATDDEDQEATDEDQIDLEGSEEEDQASTDQEGLEEEDQEEEDQEDTDDDGDIKQVIGLLQKQNVFIQDLATRVTGLESQIPEQENNGQRIKEIADSFNKMKLKGKRPKVKGHRIPDGGRVYGYGQQ